MVTVLTMMMMTILNDDSDDHRSIVAIVIDTSDSDYRFSSYHVELIMIICARVL